MTSRFTLPYAYLPTINGTPMVGGKLYFYESGTTTPKPTYSDELLTIANPNPAIADLRGFTGSIWLEGGQYKVVFRDQDDVEIWTADPVSGGGDLENTVAYYHGDGVETAFPLPFVWAGAQTPLQFNVYLDGICQAPSDYTISAGTLTFLEAPPFADEDGRPNIVVRPAGPDTGARGVPFPNVSAYYQGDGVETIFTLPEYWDEATSSNQFLVLIDGIVQFSNTYSIAGGLLTFISPPPYSTTDNIEVRPSIGNANVAGTTGPSVTTLGNIPVWASTNGTVLGAGYAPSDLPVIAEDSTTPRTLAARFSDYVNVLDYGAAPDGTTDSTTAIAAAFAVASAAGKIVFFPPGAAEYRASQITATTSVFAAGALFKPLPNSGEFIRLDADDIIWDGGIIDADKANQTVTPGHTIVASGKTGLRVKAVVITNSPRCAGLFTDCSDLVVDDCHAYESDLTAWQVFCTSTDISNVQVKNCTGERLDDPGYSGGCVKFTNNSVGSHVMRNCTIGPGNVLSMAEDASGPDSVVAEIWSDTNSGGWGCSIEANEINGGMFQASLSRVDASIISGNKLRNGNSIAAEMAHCRYCLTIDNSVDIVDQTNVTGISLSNSGSTGNAISGNNIIASGSGSYLRGIYVGDRATDTVITGNFLPANFATAVFLNGAVRARVWSNTLSGTGNEGIGLFVGCQYVDIGYNQLLGTWTSCVRVAGNSATYTTDVIAIHHNNMAGASPNHYLIDGSYLGANFQIYDNENIPWGREVLVVDPSSSPTPSFVVVAVSNANARLYAWGSNGGMPYLSSDSGGIGLRPNTVDTFQLTSTAGASLLIHQGAVSSTMRLSDTGAATNNKAYDLVSDGGVFSIASKNDAGTEKYRAITVDASGNMSIGGVPGSETLYVPPLGTSTSGVAITPSTSGIPGVVARGAAANLGMSVRSKGVQAVYIMTDSGTSQVRVLHTAGSDRYVDMTGGNGAAPRIFASSGALGIASPLELTNQTTGTTAPAAGAAGALPATPAGYLTITIGGIVRQIPYY